MDVAHPQYRRTRLWVISGLSIVLPIGAILIATQTLPPPGGWPPMPWWGWPLVLFLATFAMGILAVLGGVGGGVLFVPLVAGFFPFHLDFVRGAGLLVALAGALAAGPGLLRSGLADLRLILPVALVTSIASVVGALIGLALPTDMVQLALGLTILGVAALMLVVRRSEYPAGHGACALAQALRIQGIYVEASSGERVDWRIHRGIHGLAAFTGVGMLAGMFGLGAGWANVPVFNLLMGAPLKLSVASSKFLLSITDTSAAWVYINQGAVLGLVVVPSVLGIMLGSRIGVKLLVRTQPSRIRHVVIVILLFAGLRSVLKGLGI